MLSSRLRPAATCTGFWDTKRYADASQQWSKQATLVVDGSCTVVCAPAPSVPSSALCPGFFAQTERDLLALNPTAVIYNRNNTQSGWAAQPAGPGKVAVTCSSVIDYLPTNRTTRTFVGVGMTAADARRPLVIPGLPPAPPWPNEPITCTTCDDLPSSTPAEAQAKFRCQEKNRNGIPSTEARARALVTAQMKLMFEMHGHKFLASQISAARNLYEFDRTAAPSCGSANTLPLTCTSFSRSEWLLEHCARLTGSHVPGAVLLGNFNGVIAQCQNVLRLLSSTTQSACASYLPEARRINDVLLDKVFVDMDAKALAATRADERISAYAWAIAAVDYWYRQLSSLDRGAALDTQLTGALGRFFGHIEGVRRQRSSLIAALLTGSTAEASRPEAERVASIDASRVDQDALDRALGDVGGLAAATEQEVLAAAVRDVLGNGTRAANGTPLLAVLGAVFSSVTERSDALTPAHDVACRLAGCGPAGSPSARATRLSRLWALIGRADDGQGLARELAATTDALSGWRDTLALLGGANAEIVRALGALLGRAYVTDDLVRLDPGATPSSAMKFASAVAKAKLRSQTFASTGQLVRGAGRRMVTSAEAAKRDDIVAELGATRAEVRDRDQHYREEIVRLVQGMVAERQNEAVVARIEERRRRVAEELLVLEERRAAHIAADQGADDMAALSAAFAAVSGSVDGNQYVSVSGYPLVRLSGADARYVQGVRTRISHITAQAPMPLEAGQILSLSTEGSWAPTCTLRAERLVSPVSGRAVGVNTSASLTGPEGFGLVWTGSQYDASSATDQHSASVTLGVRGEVCAGPSTPFGSARACAYADASAGQSYVTADVEGSERRVSSAFHSGIYLSRTPVWAPVGSLVVVELPRGETDLLRARDVHLVRAPHTAITVSAASDLYLVVNDELCDQPDTQNALSVSARTLVSAQEVSRQVQARMGVVLGELRAARLAAMARGEVLPSELGALESHAYLTALTGVAAPGVPAIDVSAYPAPLLTLFNAFVDRELLRIERHVRVVNIDRELVTLGHELNALLNDLRLASSSQALLRSLPAWAAGNIDAEYTYASTQRLGRVIADYVQPVLELWFPAVHASVASSSAVARVLDSGPDRPIHELTADMIHIADDILGPLALANLSARTSVTARRAVAVAFRRPDVDPSQGFGGFSGFDPSGFGPGAQYTAYRTADPARAAALWAALEAGQAGAVRFVPEDVYRNSGTAVLPCAQELPVLRHLAFAIVRPNHVSNADVSILDTLLHHVAGDVSDEMTFASASGPVTYHLDNPRWLGLEAPLVFTDVWNALTLTNAAIYTPQGVPRVNVMGVSPFTTFSVDWSSVTPADLMTATEVVAFMELESVASPTAQPVAGVATCR